MLQQLKPGQEPNAWPQHFPEPELRDHALGESIQKSGACSELPSAFSDSSRAGRRGPLDSRSCICREQWNTGVSELSTGHLEASCFTTACQFYNHLSKISFIFFLHLPHMKDLSQLIYHNLSSPICLSFSFQLFIFWNYNILFPSLLFLPPNPWMYPLSNSWPLFFDITYYVCMHVYV